MDTYYVAYWQHNNFEGVDYYIPDLANGGGMPTAPPTTTNSIDWELNAYRYVGGWMEYQSAHSSNIGDLTAHYQYGDYKKTDSRGMYAYITYGDPILSLSNIVGTSRTLYGNIEEDVPIGTNSYIHILQAGLDIQSCSGVLPWNTNFYAYLTTNASAFSTTKNGSYYEVTETNFSFLISGWNEHDTPYCSLTASGDYWPYDNITNMKYYFDNYYIEIAPAFLLIKPTFEYK